MWCNNCSSFYHSYIAVLTYCSNVVVSKPMHPKGLYYIQLSKTVYTTTGLGIYCEYNYDCGGMRDVYLFPISV